jgi:hypothetical protein
MSCLWGYATKLIVGVALHLGLTEVSFLLESRQAI